MSSWHQQRARRRPGFTLEHATEWRVLHDPPGAPASLQSFTLQANAVSCMHRRNRWPGGFNYLVAPAWVHRCERAMAQQLRDVGEVWS